MYNMILKKKKQEEPTSTRRRRRTNPGAAGGWSVIDHAASTQSVIIEQELYYEHTPTTWENKYLSIYLLPILARCIIFFLMLFLLGLDSEFALFETVLCAVFDAFPRLRCWFQLSYLKTALTMTPLIIHTLRRQKVFVTAALVFVCFLLGLPCITQVKNVWKTTA